MGDLANRHPVEYAASYALPVPEGSDCVQHYVVWVSLQSHQVATLSTEKRISKCCHPVQIALRCHLQRYCREHYAVVGGITAHL